MWNQNISGMIHLRLDTLVIYIDTVCTYVSICLCTYVKILLTDSRTDAECMNVCVYVYIYIYTLYYIYIYIIYIYII